MDRDTPALELARLVASGETLEAFFADFADLLKVRFDGARLFVALNDSAAGRLVRAFGPDVEIANPDEEPRLARAVNEGIARIEEDGAFFPLAVGEDNLGVAAVYKPDARALAPHEAERIAEYLRYLALRIDREHLQGRIRELEALAAVDGLTGVFNRRSFDERLALEWNRAMRSGDTLAVVMTDIDYFKAFNDRYGHVAGDFCLRAVASALRESVGRASDIVARYGGEEFAAILAGTDLAGAIDVGEKMRASVGGLSIPHDASSLGRVSVSVGVATMQARPELQPTILVEKADRALYDAKSGGRNRVVAEEYASDSTPATPRHERNDNIPAPLTRFFGRIPELIAIRTLFDETRLVTLTGSGGVGKTRLAIAHASSVAAQFEDGAWFIDLASSVSETDVVRATERALGLRESRGDQPYRTVIDHLRNASALLVFDNCEHVLDAVALLVSAILTGAPLCAVLATSREPLGVDGERVFRVPSLASGEAVELFSDRAAAAGAPAFRDDGRRVASELCERLDGIPMALELAAARLRGMSLGELSRGLGDRFALLNRGARAAMPRHKTLGALIDWSYQSLSDEERTIFNHLAVFAGSFSADAACTVCTAFPPETVRLVLRRLFDKSLIESLGDADPARFRLLETMRQFAHERLSEAGQLEAAASAHAAHFAKVAVDSERRWASIASEEWRAALRWDGENFTRALRWSLELKHDPRVGASLAAALSRYWVEMGEEVWGLSWLERALAEREALDDATLGSLLLAHCRILLLVGRQLDSEVSARRALDLFSKLGDEYGTAKARGFIGGVRAELGDSAGAREWLLQALEAYRSGGHQRDLASILVALSFACFEESDYASARDYQTQALEVGRAAGYDMLVGVALGNLGEIASCLGDGENAVRYTEEALDLLERIGAKTHLTRNRVNLASFLMEMEQRERARVLLCEALENIREQPDSLYTANFFDIAAHFGVGSAQDATMLYAFTDAMYERLDAKLHVHRRTRRDSDKTDLRTKLGNAWNSAVVRGRSMNKSQALELTSKLLEHSLVA